jgi:hypothetical protein
MAQLLSMYLRNAISERLQVFNFKKIQNPSTIDIFRVLCRKQCGNVKLNCTEVTEYLMSCALSGSAVTSGTSRTDSHRTDSCHLQIWPQNWHFSAKKADVLRGDGILNLTELNKYLISRAWHGADNFFDASTTAASWPFLCHLQIWPQYLQFNAEMANVR